MKVLVLLALSTVAAADVEVAGNRRTDRDVILATAAVPNGELDAADLADVRQRLLNTKLFETVEVTREGTSVQIRVKERWTLFPIPYVSSSSRGTQGGLFLLESNLFGRNKTVVVGGSYSSWGVMGFGLYIDPAVAGTRATLRASALYAQTTRERRVDDRTVFEYDDDRADTSLLGGYRITDRFQLSAGWFVSNVAATSDVMLPTGTNHGFTAALEYRGADLRRYYDDGITASAVFRHASRELGAERDVIDASARAQLTHAWIGDQATSAILQVDAIDGDPILDARLLGGRTGSRGFEQQTLWVERAVTLTLDHQVPILERGWGTTTITGFVDAGYVESELGNERFLNPGMGMRLYLARMNFPALGFDVTYAPAFERTFVNVSVGMSM